MSKSQADVRYRAPRVMCLRLQPTALVCCAQPVREGCWDSVGGSCKDVGFARAAGSERFCVQDQRQAAGSAPGCRISAGLQDQRRAAGSAPGCRISTRLQDQSQAAGSEPGRRKRISMRAFGSVLGLAGCFHGSHEPWDFL